MAQILSFRAKAKAAQSPGPEQDFLHHDDHTLSFQVTETGATSLGNLLEHRAQESRSLAAKTPPPSKDWTNQELADLYRVKHLLDAAGIPNQLERGLTDEGDPWLVFCGPDAEVFIHLCRLDGIYLLDSPNVQTPLRGANFNALIEAFTNRALPRTPAEGETDSRVIRLERGGKVYLHPSVLLAALIWTLFLAAEEIVLLVPDEDQANDGLADLAALTYASTAQDSIDMPVLVCETNIPLEEVAGRTNPDSDPRHVAGHEAFLRDNGHAGLTMTHNSYGMGLSAIAIAFGFMAEQSLTQTEPGDPDQALAADTGDSLHDDAASLALTDNKRQAIQDPDDPAMVELAILTAEDRRPAAETAESSGLDAAEVIAATKAFLSARQNAGTKAAETKIWIDTQSDTAFPENLQTVQASAQASAQANTLAPETTSPADTANALPSLITLSTLRTAFQPTDMKSFAFGNVVVQASFDLTQSPLGEALPFLDTDSGTDPTLSTLIDISAPITTGFRSFDQDARAFMDFILGKTSGVEMISLGSELILIDAHALSYADTYVLSWELDDGGVISMIGLKTEFQQFDLIA